MCILRSYYFGKWDFLRRIFFLSRPRHVIDGENVNCFCCLIKWSWIDFFVIYTIWMWWWPLFVDGTPIKWDLFWHVFFCFFFFFHWIFIKDIYIWVIYRFGRLVDRWPALGKEKIREKQSVWRSLSISLCERNMEAILSCAIIAWRKQKWTRSTRCKLFFFFFSFKCKSSIQVVWWSRIDRHFGAGSFFEYLVECWWWSGFCSLS